jgi:hypothetical protein
MARRRLAAGSDARDRELGPRPSAPEPGCSPARPRDAGGSPRCESHRLGHRLADGRLGGALRCDPVGGSHRTDTRLRSVTARTRSRRVGRNPGAARAVLERLPLADNPETGETGETGDRTVVDYEASIVAAIATRVDLLGFVEPVAARWRAFDAANDEAFAADPARPLARARAAHVGRAARSTAAALCPALPAGRDTPRLARAPDSVDRARRSLRPAPARGRLLSATRRGTALLPGLPRARRSDTGGPRPRRS